MSKLMYNFQFNVYILQRVQQSMGQGGEVEVLMGLHVNNTVIYLFLHPFFIKRKIVGQMSLFELFLSSSDVKRKQSRPQINFT